MSFPMKTGFNNLICDDNNISPDFKLKINAIMFTLIEKAIEVGVKYSKSSGRNNLSSTDLLYALQYQAHEFLDYPDLTEKCIENEDTILKEMESDEDEYDFETDSNSESDEENEENEENEEFCRSISDDPIISKMNEYHDSWNDWTPEDEIRKMIKKSIDEHFSNIIM